MAFPKAIAAAQRSALHGDVLEALDHAEALHRDLGTIDAAHLVALRADQLDELRQLAKTAYDALAKARTITGRPSR